MTGRHEEAPGANHGVGTPRAEGNTSETIQTNKKRNQTMTNSTSFTPEPAQHPRPAQHRQHERIVSGHGRFPVAIVLHNGHWMIDPRHLPGLLLIEQDALDYADAIKEAALEADRRNRRRTVRRPIDWAAQPDLDGAGGGL